MDSKAQEYIQMWTEGSKENTEVIDDMETSEDMLLMIDEKQIARLTKRLQSATNKALIQKVI